TPGHTSNHMCFALLEEKVLFTGDHVMGWSTSIVSPPDGNMEDYMASLRLLLERDDEVYWPTHGPAITDPKPFVRSFIEHREDRERQIVEQLKAGRTKIADMVPIMYAAVDKRLYPAAARSVLAHMEHLVATGIVATDGKPSLASDYRLA
ncbi:MAG TPA: MBL fold metallo-hydrolase, partial [Rhodobiaceae bacterium]|nr:MBL fold metallo-hydrolase [Rhodobiaceae bacterium]